MFETLPVNVRGWCCGLAGAGGYLGLLVVLHGLGLFDWFGFFTVQSIIIILCMVTLQPHNTSAAYRRVIPAYRRPSSEAIQSAFTTMFWLVVLVGVLTPNAWLRAKPMGNPATADVWIVFGFGLVETKGVEEAGASNLALADWLLAHHDGRTPIIVQHGITLALQQRERETGQAIPPECFIPLPHDPAIYVNTREATKQTLATMREHGWQKPLLVAHDLQLQRMAWDFARLNCDDVVIPPIPPIPFEQQSTQHWGTQGVESWTIWEVVLARPATGHNEWLSGVLCLLAGAVGWSVYRDRQRHR